MVGTEAAFPNGQVPTAFPSVQLVGFRRANIKLERVMPTYVLYVEVPAS